MLGEQRQQQMQRLACGWAGVVVAVFALLVFLPLARAQLNLLGGTLQKCSGSGMALTGFTRNGPCVSRDDDHGSHHVCIDLNSTAGGNFCAVTVRQCLPLIFALALVTTATALCVRACVRACVCLGASASPPPLMPHAARRDSPTGAPPPCPATASPCSFAPSGSGACASGHSLRTWTGLAGACSSMANAAFWASRFVLQVR